MRLFKTKHYREVPCKACDGTGKIMLSFVGTVHDPVPWKLVNTLKEYQNICLSCNGRGTQTVMERVE